MAENDQISFLLDLDVTQFTEKGLQAKGIIEQLGSSENLTGLLEGLTTAGTILGTVGIAAFAFKKAIDLTVEGEQIERVNEQFDTLATQAGIAPETLRKGLEAAASGLVSTNDLLKISNEAIIKMGGSAEKLPQIMEIARKATQVYGGDAKNNFEAITEAIANGNTRILKHYGIIIDATKAQKDFAAANGTTVDQLSEVGKRQAILNAALASGNEAFKNVALNAKSATTILQTLKTTFTEIGETFTLAFEKTIGPGIRSFLGGVKDLATSLKLHMQASIGEGADQAAAKLTLTKDKVSELEAELAKLQKIKGTALDFAPGDTQAKIIGLTAQLAKYRVELQSIQKQTKENEKEDDQAGKAHVVRTQLANQNAIVDQDKKKKNEQAFRKDLEKIDLEYFKAQQSNVNSLAQVEAMVSKQREATARDHKNRVLQIQNDEHLSTSQKGQLEVLENKRFEQMKLADDEQTEKLREQLLQNYLKHSENVFQGIERAAQVSAHNASEYLSDFGKQGAEVMQSIQTYSTQAFEQMGQAAAQGTLTAQSAADAMKNIFLNVIADRAIASGAELLLEGIFPPNPIALGAGAGLIALGGALRSMAGGTGTTVGGAVGGGVGTSGIGVVTQSQPSPTQSQSSTPAGTPSGQDVSMATSNMSQQAPTQRTVQVNIAGNYLETDQTRRMLMDLMRQESDATGFSYNQIGA